jgi:hypothetical protein
MKKRLRQLVRQIAGNIAKFESTGDWQYLAAATDHLRDLSERIDQIKED